MTRRSTVHPNQFGFAFDPPQAASEPAELAGLERQISRAIAAMLKDDQRSRDVIAAEMSVLLEEDVSKYMLDAYASPARPEHKVPASRLLAAVAVTNRFDLLDRIMRHIGAAVLVGAEVHTARLGQIDRKIAELQAERKAQEPLSEQQLKAVLATVEAERKRSLVLRDQRALIQTNIQAVQSFRSALEQTVANALQGKFNFNAILSSLGNSAINIISQRTVESLFGKGLRDAESGITGGDKVDVAVTGISNALGKATPTVTSFADALEKASGRISAAGIAANDNGSAAAAANDNAAGGFDSPDGDIVVTAANRRPLAGQGAAQELTGLAGGFLRDLGIKIPNVFGISLKGSLGKLEKSLPNVLQGAFTGASASRIILGDRGIGGTIGSAIGGAIGGEVGKKVLSEGLSAISSGLGKFAGPLGSVVGGLLGGLLGGLFQPVPHGTAALTSTSASGQKVTGNTSQDRSTAGSLGDAVRQGLQQISQQLGGDLGKFSVAIGQFNGSYRVNTNATNASLNYNNFGHDTLYDFGKEGAAAAISFAIMDAVKDGAVEGLSAAVQQALKSSTDINEGLAEALKVADLQTKLGGIGASLQQEFKTFEKTAADRLRIAKTYGFDIVKVEELNAKERLALSEKLLKDQVGSLQSLIDSITSGDLFEGSAVDKRAALLDKIAAARVDANAGVEGAADTLSQLLEQLNSVSKDAFGTTGGFAADQQAILDAARDAIAKANQRVNDAQKATDPALAVTNQQLDESNDQLAKIAAYLGTSVDYLKAIAAQGENDNYIARLKALAAY